MATLLRRAPSLNTYEGMYDRLSSKASFNHDEWIHAANEGTLDMYAASIDKFESLGIDYQKYKDDLNLSFADAKTRMTALYNEVYADRENQKERERTVTDENGVPRIEKYMASDYDYNKELIKSQNDYREEVERQRIADEAKESASFWEHLLWGTVGIGTGIAQGVMNGMNNLSALTDASLAWIGSGGKIDFAQRLANSDALIFGDLPQQIAEFETKYTTLRYANGDYTNLGKYIGGASTSVGEMIPSMLIGKGVGGILTKAGVSAATAGAVAAGTAQATFYTGMFSGTVKDMYRQFQVMGADVDSSSIVANAAIKSALQWGVEKALGKMLGATSIDNLVFGRAQNPVGAKIGGWKAVGHILKDAGQEGLEEVLQDTSDFLVNEGFSNFIDAYGVNNEISFQSLLDAFTIGAMVSIAGSAVDVLKTRRVIGSDGKKLGKLASWEYGINMDTFAKNVSEVMEKAAKVNYETDNRKKNLIQGAALEAYASYRLVTSIYQEIGDERFKAANEVLNKVTEQIQSGKFNKEDVTSYVENMRGQFGHVSNLAFEKMKAELKKKNVKEVKRTITADDTKTTKKGTETKEKLTPEEARDKLEELFEVSGAETVTETDGNVEVEKDGNIVISSDRLNNESINEILQNLSVQNLVSHLSELSNKERIRDKLSKTYEEYYGKTASEDADIISLLFDADFFKAVLMKSNKDVFKYLSYFAEAEKSLVRGKRRDEIYRNKIKEIRNHWFNHLADYCIIHEEANPTMFLNYISDVKKRKEIENKVKKGRWGTDIYNRVLLSESNLDKLSENEKVVLRTRFDNAFAKSIATRHWNNVNSNNAAARQQSMNALSNKYQGLFSSKYDGVTYMPDISIGNRVFNKFMQSLGLDLSTLLNKNYLTESDVKLITDDYGKVDENSILNFRKAQFKEMSTVYDFTINKSWHFEVTHKGKIVGFSKYRKLQKDIEEGKKADTFVTDTKVKSDRLSKLINTDLIATSASYYTVDDVITDPQLLKTEVQNEIIKFANNKYGLKLTRPTADTTFLYLRNYFLSEFKDMTIVMSNDGEFVFASVKKIVDLFKNPNIKITKDTKLSDIIKDKYLPEGLNLKIVEGSNSAKYVPYKNVEKDGSSITVLDNTIYIGDKVFEDGDDYVRFVFAHEFQHALQFINNINAGVSNTWLDYCDKKQRKVIIADIRNHKPELFKGVKEGSEIESRIANDFVYHSTGETDAYGIQGNEVLDFVPVVSKNDKNVLTFTMPWGTVHKINNVKKADVISSIWKKEADNLYKFSEFEDLYPGTFVDPRIDDSFIRVSMSKAFIDDEKLAERQSKILSISRYFDTDSQNASLFSEWLRKDINTNSADSEDIKHKIVNAITDDDRKKSIEALRLAIAPDVEESELLQMEIPFVRIQMSDELKNSPFVSVFVGGGVDAIQYMLSNSYKSSSHKETFLNTNLIVGTLKAKDLLLYIPTKYSEGFIEPSKLSNSKMFKLNNKFHSNFYVQNVMTFMFDLGGNVIVNPYVVLNKNGTLKRLFDGINGKEYRTSQLDELDVYFIDADVNDVDAANYLYNDPGLVYKKDKLKKPEYFDQRQKSVVTWKNDWWVNNYNNFLALRQVGNRIVGDYVYADDNEFYLDVYATDPNGRVITPEETETSIENLDSLYDMSLKHESKFKPIGKPNEHFDNVNYFDFIDKSPLNDELTVRSDDPDFDFITDEKQSEAWERAYEAWEENYNDTLYNWVHGGKNGTKRDVISVLNSDLRRLSFELFNVTYAYGVPFDELLEMDIPFMRMQENDKLFDDHFVSVSVLGDKYSMLYHLDDWNSVGDKTNVIVGTLKLRDALLYIGEAESEILIHPSKIYKKSKIYTFEKLEDGYYVSEGKNVDYVSHDLSPDFYGMSLKPKSTGKIKKGEKYLKEDDPRAKNFISSVAHPNHQYKERLYELNEDGTQKLDKKGKPIYHYVPPEKKSRYVSKRKYAGTKLEPFTKSYKRTQMPIELQNFILNSKDLDPVLQERIDGNKEGTLTQQYVFDYLRSKENIDDNTFKQINDAFFHNEHIKTFKELQYRIDHGMRESWAVYRLFKLNEELRGKRHLLDSSAVSLEYMLELIERKPEYLEQYSKLLLEYDNQGGLAYTVDDSYAKMRYMRKYDGTIHSERDVSSVARLIAILEAISESKDEKGNTIKKKWTTQKINSPEFMEAYSDAVEATNLSQTEMIEAIITREGAKWVEEGLSPQESLPKIIELSDKLYSMSINEVRKLYDGKENTFDNVVMEGVVADAYGSYLYISPDAPKQTSANLVNRMKNKIRSLKRNLTSKEIENIVKKHNDIFGDNMSVNRELYQNKIDNKTRGGHHYENKSVEEVQEVFDKVVEICDNIREEKRIGKAAVDAKDKRIKQLERYSKQLERDVKNQKADKIPKVYEIIVEDERIEIETNKEIPLSLFRILQVHYNKVSKSKVQNLSSGNENHIRVSSSLFYEENAENLNNLTQADVDEIIDFYLKTDVPFNEATASYRTAMILTLTYIVEAGRKGNINFVVDSDTITKVEKRLRQTISRAGIDLRIWSVALKRLNPEKVIANSIARKTGVDIPEADINRLVEAVESRDMKEVEKVKREIYESLLAKSNRKRDTLDKLLQYERLAMLSGPGTWIRNLTSNLLVTGVNKLSDGRTGDRYKLLDKLFPKSKNIESQYKISGTKVTKEVSDYIEANLISNGLLDKVIGSLNKYDVRKSTTGKSNEIVLASMIADSVCREFSHQPLFNDKVFSKVEEFILKKISDDKFVIKAAKGYLGKMITEDIESGRIKAKNEVLWSNGISKQFMTYVAEAFKLASYDYMHKPNIIFDFESKLAKKSKGAYFVYKQIFPFVGASWNWFVEGLKYNPIALGIAIKNYAKLENTIDKYERKRQTFAHGDVGISSDFAKYLTKRDITKGAIGTIGFIIGALLAGFGVAKLDEEDYKYKLYFGKDKNVVIDVSDIYGTQGIFLGMSLTSTLIDSLSDRDGVFDDILDITSATLDQMFMDSTFADFFNTFRYSQNLGDWLTYQPINVANMFVPNFLKTLTSLFTPHKINYGTGFLGKVGRLATSVFPFLPYLFPTYYDPYTGEKQIPQKLWLLTSLATKLTPIDLSIYNISDMERIAIQEGVHKSQLTGRYKINGEEVKLKVKQIKALNELYGQLNSTDLKELQSNSKTYKVKQANGTFKNLRWSQMTDKEKATIIDRIMTDNSGYAKIFILTDSGDYKYFATDSEFSALRALGITKNVYRKNNKYSGFVKAN